MQAPEPEDHRIIFSPEMLEMAKEWPEKEFELDVEAWVNMIVQDRRRPSRLHEMPTQGKVVVASHCRWQAAVHLASKEGLDYFLNDLVPSDQLYVMDIDQLT